MRFISWAVGLFLAWIALSLCIAGVSGEFKQSKNKQDCWTIPRDSATGTIRCWSGGQLVYQNSIYHNGGVLCSSDGKEIKITGGKSLCVIESNQDSAWEPPIEKESK